MKKSILIIAILLGTVFFTSCKETKKEEANSELHEHDGVMHEDHDHEKMAEVYQCPMDCEEGKTYAEEGNCPVCKMDLKEKKVDMDSMHAEDCKCMADGECKCEDGKCKCKDEMATTKM
ncbi:MAG TPA: heavy metal-binding domain-containing protein, partial [Flavobacteriaceae bacterium]|nr:heavy metal-binding domain-containing protein [Flavobacteriaceae bacterium]